MLPLLHSSRREDEERMMRTRAAVSGQQIENLWLIE